MAKAGQKLTKTEIEIITWKDAVVSVGWEEGDGSLSPPDIVSIGFILNETKEFITLCSTWGKNDTTTNNRISIPKGWILGRKKMKLVTH